MEYIPRYGTEDCGEKEDRFVEYPVRDKKLLEKLEERLLAIC